VLKILLGAMAAGIVAFIGVCFIIRQPVGPLPPRPDDHGHAILLIVLVGLGLAELPAYFVVRSAIKTQLRREFEHADGDVQKVEPVGAYFTLTIIAAALAEAWGLFGAIIYILSGAWVAIIAPVVTVAILIGLLPTRYKYDCFVEDVSRPNVL
jgi:hypothetical protein